MATDDDDDDDDDHDDDDDAGEMSTGSETYWELVASPMVDTCQPHGTLHTEAATEQAPPEIIHTMKPADHEYLPDLYRL